MVIAKRCAAKSSFAVCFDVSTGALPEAVFRKHAQGAQTWRHHLYPSREPVASHAHHQGTGSHGEGSFCRRQDGVCVHHHPNLPEVCWPNHNRCVTESSKAFGCKNVRLKRSDEFSWISVGSVPGEPVLSAGCKYGALNGTTLGCFFNGHAVVTQQRCCNSGRFRRALHVRVQLFCMMTLHTPDIQPHVEVESFHCPIRFSAPNWAGNWICSSSS